MESRHLHTGNPVLKFVHNDNVILKYAFTFNELRRIWY